VARLHLPTTCSWSLRKTLDTQLETESVGFRVLTTYGAQPVAFCVPYEVRLDNTYRIGYNTRVYRTGTSWRSRPALVGG
jgi:hypothetical protein